MLPWLADDCGLDDRAGTQLVAYLAAGRAALGALPRKDLLIAERFFDEGGGMQLVLHAPLGGRINRAWGLALRKRFCRGFNFELQASATDDGIVISLGQPHAFPLDTVFAFVPQQLAEEVLVQALLDRPMFEIRWRWNVTRSLTVLRRHGGKKVPPHLVKMRANDTLSVVFPQAQACLETIVGDREIPDHPLVFETIRDCLVEAMDSEGMAALMGRLERGEVQVVSRDTVEPSPLSHELLNANPYAFLDDAPLEERRARAVTLRRGLPADTVEAAGVLDAEAIALAVSEAAPTVRDVDELHDALLALWLVPEAQGRAFAAGVDGAGRWFEHLVDGGRAVVMVPAAGPRLWVATERLGVARAIFPDAVVTPAIETPPWATVLEREAAILKVIGAQLDHRGPISGPALAAELGLPDGDVLTALLGLEADGAILRGSFTAAAPPRTGIGTVREAMTALDDKLTPSPRGEAPGDGTAGLRSDPTRGPSPDLRGAAGDGATAIEWCNRRVLARIHRLTLARLRREIEPVTAAALMRFLLRWQRVARHTQVIGADGLGRILEQLQGFETAAGAWERELLPARISNYDPTWLDQLCLAGHVVWCRLSPKAAISEAELAAMSVSDADAASGPAPTRQPRSVPTRSAPLALMLRRDASWLRAAAAVGQVAPPALGDAAFLVRDHLAAAGASFLGDLAGAIALPPDQLEDALWELVGAGLATADGFASLRILVDRKRGETRSVFDGPRGPALPGPSPANDDVPPARRWMEAIKKARSRDRVRPSHALRALPTAAGRWSLLPPARPEAIDAEASARQLLARYGVVFRDLLIREASLPPWRELLVALRRLEARGEIRGGRFVSGFVGEQFALPEALDELRAARAATPTGAAPDTARVAATDPLNLVGVLTPGPRVPAVVGNAILYVDGNAVASVEGGQLVLRGPLPDGGTVAPDLTYQPPARPPAPAAQVTLAL
jgi:ATP-dependent Lhr-like helicase